MDVVRKIGRAPTGSKGFYDDVPIRPIVIENVQILK
jgi:cyclophilin family peptidyl-prolyl cis-trans isomerase